MHITVKIADLTREMILLEKVISKKANPVLQNVLMRAEDGQLILTASDIEIELTCRCPVVVEEPGTITVPAKRLLDLLRVQSGGLLTLASKADAVHFTSGAFKSRLQTLSPQDFPLLPDITGHALILPRVAFQRALAQVRFVVEEKTQAQYFMQGVKIDVTDGTVVAVATSSQRLALTSFSTTAEDTSMLLPVKVIDELLALLVEEGPQEVQCSHTEQHLSFMIGGRHLKSGQISGQFPAYRRVIPTESTTTVTVPRLELAGAIRRTLLIDNVIHLSVGEVIALSSKSSTVGESQEEIKVDRRGPETEITLRGDHLLDFLNAAMSQTITMELKTKTNPMLLTDGAYLTVIMGMSL